MSTNQKKNISEKSHSPSPQPVPEKKRPHSLCSAELPSSTIRFDDFFGVDRMVLEHPSARCSMRRIFSEGPSQPMMPLPQTDGASDRRKLKRNKKQKKKAKNKTKNNNDDCRSERSQSTIDHDLPADTENAGGVQVRDSAAEVVGLSGASEQLTSVCSEPTSAVASSVLRANGGLTPALPVSLSPLTPSAGTRPVSIKVLGPAGNNAYVWSCYL